MKLIPTAIARKVARQQLLASKHSPSILFGAGVVGMVGSTVLACRATLKLDEVLERAENDLYVTKSMDSEDYSETDRKKDTAIIYFRGVGSVVKLYAPSVMLGAASIGCLTKSHNILQERNLALTAAYAAVDEAFKTYRARVVEKYGVDEDRRLRYEMEQVDVIDEETGEVKSVMVATPDDHSMYARWYDSESSANWDRDPDINLLFLRTQQNWANDMLHARGHLFLNEVYSMLGLAHTPPGALVGWVVTPDKESGDNFVDFGLWDYENNIPHDHVNGREGAILLDFNVDGTMWDKIDKPVGRKPKWRK